MKKLFFLVTMMLFASGLVNAQEWVGVNENTPVRIQENLVSSSEDEIVIDVKVGGFFQTAVKTQLGEQVVISGEDMASMLVAGAPDLPMYPISMIIGNTAEMKVSVVESSYVDIQDIEVEVRTDIISLITKILGCIGILCIENTLSVYISEVHVITCVLVTSVEDDVSVNI
jgi:hypothetical protein